MSLSKHLIPLVRRRFIVVGILLSILSWLVESYVHSQLFYKQNLSFVAHMFFPDVHELWMRLFIVFLFLSFAVYVQKIITDLRSAEREILQINMELTQIFNTSADAMRVIDSNFTVLRVNNTFLNLTEETKARSIGKKCYEIFRGINCHTQKCPMARIQNGEERIEYDTVKICRNERTIPCIVTVTPFKDITGKIIGIVENFKDISERIKAEEKLKKSYIDLRNLTSHLEMVREEERMGMARELHDELGQALTGLQMDIAWIEKHLERDLSETQEKLAYMDNQLIHIINTVQRISSQLRPKLLDELGLMAAIEWQTNKIHDRLAITFNVVSIPDEILLGEKCRITVYRIFQEAVTNIVRHSNATQVEIFLVCEKDHINLTIEDNGKGISPKAINNPQSLGILGMRERAEQLDGTFFIMRKSNRGTKVFLSIPHGNCN